MEIREFSHDSDIGPIVLNFGMWDLLDHIYLPAKIKMSKVDQAVLEIAHSNLLDNQTSKWDFDSDRCHNDVVMRVWHHLACATLRVTSLMSERLGSKSWVFQISNFLNLRNCRMWPWSYYDGSCTDHPTTFWEVQSSCFWECISE